MMNFRVQGPKGNQETIPQDGGDTVGDLYDAVSNSFDLHDVSFDLLWGYPPQLCSLDPEVLLLGSINPNERIKVQLADQRGQQAQGTSPMTTSKKRGSKKKASPGGGAGAAMSSSQPSNTFGARVMTLSGPASSNHKKRGSSSSSSSRKRARKSSGGDGESSGAAAGDPYSGITDAMMAAVAGGSSGQDKELRNVFRNAVGNQYKSTQDVARLAATFSGKYTIEDCQESRILASGLCAKMKVEYPMSVGGAGGKGTYTDTVDIVEVETMRAAMMIPLRDTEPGGGREFLKPANLARGSPRLFWSLVRAFGPDIANGLRQLFPQVRSVFACDRNVSPLQTQQRIYDYFLSDVCHPLLLDNGLGMVV